LNNKFFQYIYIFYGRIILVLLFAGFYLSCANQLPPSGGEDDKIPPKIITSEPLNNTLNYKNNFIYFEFDEYVDRRSFEESFFISPKPKGKKEFDWNGKSVRVIFSEGFLMNSTYNVVISKGLKDIRAGNQLTAPINFAFSTGNMLDISSLAGKVYAENYKNVYVVAYILNKNSDTMYNPSKFPADYITQTDEKGFYKLNNLPVGNYRIFALKDNDNNLLYDKDFDEISVLPDDIKISDSLSLSNVNFLLLDIEKKFSCTDYQNFYPVDSSGLLYSNLRNNDAEIPNDLKFYFYFKSGLINKYDLAENLTLINFQTNENIKLVFNWLSDTLVELILNEHLLNLTNYKFNLEIKNSNIKFLNYITFKTAGERKYVKLSGFVENFSVKNNPVNIYLYNSDKIFIQYKFQAISDSTFFFKNVYDGNYLLFAFLNTENINTYKKGKPYPYVPSDEFIYIDEPIKLKGGMSINLFRLRLGSFGN
jgi:hypothetical protein